MKSVLFSFLVATAASVTIVPKSEAGSTPTDVKLISVSYSGNGCTEGTVRSDISANYTTLTFGFDAFQAPTGPGINSSDSGCNLRVRMEYTAGYQYAVESFTWSGFAKLDESASLNLWAGTYFPYGGARMVTKSVEITGGGIWVDGIVYTKEERVPTSELLFAPCGSASVANITSRIMFRGNGAGATDNKRLQLNIYWREC